MNSNVTNLNSVQWQPYHRFKVGETARVGLNVYQNISGANTNPLLLLDWVFVNQTDAGKNIRIFKKGLGNEAAYMEPGDFGYGMLNDGTTFIPIGRYDGPDSEESSIQDINNWYTNVVEFI